MFIAGTGCQLLDNLPTCEHPGRRTAKRCVASKSQAQPFLQYDRSFYKMAVVSDTKLHQFVLLLSGDRREKDRDIRDGEELPSFSVTQRKVTSRITSRNQAGDSVDG